MIKRLLALPLMVALTMATIGCTPVERVAYDTIVAAKAFLDTTRSQHPECATGATSTICSDIKRAVSAKDALIDAAEVYCSSPSFDTGNGACSPPAKGTPAAQQLTQKLQAAIAAYNQSAADLKGAL